MTRALSLMILSSLAVSLLLPVTATNIVHRRVNGLSQRFRANPLDFTEEVWLDNGQDAR